MDPVAKSQTWDPSSNIIPEGYDYRRSTQENYGSNMDVCGIFHGDFANVRERIDPRWHGCYGKSRQLLQDEIIKGVTRLNSRIVPTESARAARPWIIFTGGAMGSGKGYCMHWMIKHKFVPMKGLLHVDPDVFKQSLPEWKGYVKSDPQTAGSLTHLESCMMVEIAQELALQHAIDVWVDGSLSNSEWTYSQLRRIREYYRSYRIAVFHVSASEANILERCNKRARSTGRIVPVDRTTHSIKASFATVQNIPRELVDLLVFIENNSFTPDLKSINDCQVDAQDWATLRKLFHQQYVSN